MAPGDAVIDTAGVIGIVINEVNGEIHYKASSFDGMEFVYTSEPEFLTPLSERFKKVYLRELRAILRRNDVTSRIETSELAEEEKKEKEKT